MISVNQCRQLCRSIWCSLPFDAVQHLWLRSYRIAGLLYCVAAENVHQLQVMMNAGARLVTDTGRYEQITPVLSDISHFQSNSGSSSRSSIVAVISCILQWCLDSVSRYSLAFQSASCLPMAETFTVPLTQTKIGGRSFNIAAPAAWNSLHFDHLLYVELTTPSSPAAWNYLHHLQYRTHYTFICTIKLSANDKIRSGLKTHLFNLVS